MVPTFTPNSWAMLYFPSKGLPFPHSPDDLFRAVNIGDSASSAARCDLLMLADSQGRKKDFVFCNPRELLESIEAAIQDDIMRSASRFYTIHNLGMLQRLLRWQMLKNHTVDRTQRNLVVPAITDLVEAFHYPAILTFESRSAFAVGHLRRWLLNEPAPVIETELTELNTLSKACEIL